MKKPNPGSPKAIKLLCRCPVRDNNCGIGFYGIKGLFAVQADCPLHGRKARKKTQKLKGLLCKNKKKK